MVFSRDFEVSKNLLTILGKNKTPMSEAIRSGIGLLKASAPLDYTIGSRQQTALAIYNKKTGKLFEERIWITPSGDLISTQTLPVRIVWWNSFNSVYEIERHPELIVVANKFLVERKYLPEQSILQLDEDAPQSRYTDMVYAPYSEDVHWPDVIEMGETYIAKNVDEAFEELKSQHVMSRAVPGKLVTDVISKDLVRTIVLVEQVDPGWLNLADDGGKTLVERALVIIGANQELAYRYTNSKAGANGLAQFIEPTYDLMVERYPAARLIKNHKIGMADHTNAFKAITLLFDNEMHFIQENTGVPASPQMLAAAYNGGPSRVIRAVKSHGQNWVESDIFPDETNAYVKKYEAIKKLKIF